MLKKLCNVNLDNAHITNDLYSAFTAHGINPIDLITFLNKFACFKYFNSKDKKEILSKLNSNDAYSVDIDVNANNKAWIKITAFYRYRNGSTHLIIDLKENYEMFLKDLRKSTETEVSENDYANKTFVAYYKPFKKTIEIKK